MITIDEKTSQDIQYLLVKFGEEYAREETDKHWLYIMYQVIIFLDYLSELCVVEDPDATTDINIRVSALWGDMNISQRECGFNEWEILVLKKISDFLYYIRYDIHYGLISFDS